MCGEFHTNQTLEFFEVYRFFMTNALMCERDNILEKKEGHRCIGHHCQLFNHGGLICKP